MQQARPVQFAQYAHDATGPVYIFHVVLGGAGCNLAQLWHFAGQAIDIRHGEVQLCFLGGGQQVQDGVGGAAH